MSKPDFGLLPLRAPFRLFAVFTIFLLAVGGAVLAQSTSANIATGSGTHPYAVAVNPVTNTIYVADYGAATVTAINGQNNTTTIISVGTNPVTGDPMVNPIAIAVDPVRNRVYVANQGTAAKTYKDGGVSVIDGSTNFVTATVNVPNSPVALAVNVNTNMIYVAEFANQVTSWYVGVINGTNDSETQILSKFVSGTVSILGNEPASVAVNPATNQIFFANSAGNDLTVMDGNTNAFIGGVYVSPADRPIAVAVNPVLNHVYVLSNLTSPPSVSPALSVIDVGQNGTYGVGKLLKTVTVGTNPTSLTVNPVTNEVYVANSGNTFVTVVQDGATVGNGQTIAVGNQPYGVVANPITNQIFVTNQNSNTVTVIDGASNSPTATVGVGAGPTAIAANPVTGKVYVANTGDSVSVIDAAANSTKVAFAGSMPTGVAVNPVTSKVYVANQSGESVTIIDEATDSASTVGAGGQPDAVAVNPVTNKIYVANYLSYSVTEIDGATDTTTTIRVGPHPVALAVNPVSNLVYVANQGTLAKQFADSTVTVIDGASSSTMTIPFGSDVNNGIAGPLQLTAIAIDPYLNQIYVVNKGTADQLYFDGGIYMLNGFDNFTIMQFIPACSFCLVPSQLPIAVAVGPIDANGVDKVYVANFASNDVDVFGPDGTYINTVNVGNNPDAIAANPATGYVYVANAGSNTVTSINGNVDPFTSGYDLNTATINTGSVPYAVAINPTTNKIYVADKSSNNVTVIDGTSNSATQITTGTKPYSIAVDPIAGKAFVTNSGSSNVTVITEAAASGPADPLTVQLQGVSDSGTDTEAQLFATNNANPSFTASVNSLFGPTAPPPTALFYQLDSTQGLWTQATATSGAGANPAAYSFPLNGVLPGIHTLYAYSLYGNDGGPTASNGSGYSAQPSDVVAYPFAVINPPTTVTLTANFNPQNAGMPVTFNACANPGPAVVNFGGTITFFDGSKRLGSEYINPLNPGTDPSGPNCALFSAYGLTTGLHNITAVFSGAPFLSSSFATLQENVELNLTQAILLPATPYLGAPCTVTVTTNCPVYGQTVEVAAQIPLVGTVAFSVNGQVVQSAVKVVGGRATLTLTKLAAGTYNIDATFTGASGTFYAPTLTFPVKPKPVTVAPLNLFRFYGAPNQVIHGVASGLLVADGIGYSFSTTATQASDATTALSPCYPINIAFTDPNNLLGNYIVPANPVGCFSIYPVGVTLIADSEARSYGAVDNFKGIASGVIAADAGTYSLTFTTSVAQNSPVGTYKNAIVPALSFNDPSKAGDYFIANTIKGTETISKAILYVNATPQTRQYGAADPPFTVTFTGALASDNLTGEGTCTDTATSSVGTYLITAHVDANPQLTNYLVIPKSAYLTITKAPLTVTADNQTRSAGQPNPTLTGEIVGAVPSDNITASFNTTATTSSPAGMYPITPVLVANPRLTNYQVTLVPGVLTVTP